MIFKSLHKEISVPPGITYWDWLLSEKAAFPVPNDPNTGYVDGITGQRITFHQVRDYSIRLASALVNEHNLRPGDVVSICSPNTIWYPLCTLAVMRAGGIPALSSPAYTEDEFVHTIGTVKSRFIIASPDALPLIGKAGKRLGISDGRTFSMEEATGGFKSIQDMIKNYRGPATPSQPLPAGKTNGQVPGVLCFSSGTTGLPKAVMVSHQNLIAQCLQVLATTYPDHKKVLAVLPFYHITGVVKLMTFPLIINAEVVVLSKFTMKALLDAVSRHRIPELQLVPPLLIRLVRDPLVEKYDLSFVKRFGTGAAPTSDEILALLEKKFPGSGIKQGYGLTESTGCITQHPLGVNSYEFAHRAGTLVASTQVKIVKEDGQLAGVDEQGEILAKGPQIFPGYYNNPEASAAAFDEDGFLRTGDQGSIDSNGWLTIHDRIKELIKVKGVQVAPAELEDAVLGHPKVEDAAVVGIPDDYAGELPYAFIVPKSQYAQETGIAQEIVAYIKDKKSRTKWLGGAVVVPVIPKSASGKILRRVLKKEYLDALKKPVAKL